MGRTWAVLVLLLVSCGGGTGDGVPTVGILGDSISALTYFADAGEPGLVDRMDVAATNYSVNGAKASDYLAGGRVAPSQWSGNHDAYVVFLVANEGITADMRADTSALLAEVAATDAHAILVTLYPVDYAGLHWRQDMGDRDAAIERLNQVYRDAATADDGVTLCDLWQHVADLDVWDYRIRNYPSVGGSVTDPMYWGPSSVLDGDGMGGPDDPRWYTEIHPNPYGAQLVADVMAGCIASHAGYSVPVQ